MKQRAKVALCVCLFGVVGCTSNKSDDAVHVLMGGTFSKTGVSAVSTWINALQLAADDATQGLQDAGYPTGKRLVFDTKVADTKNDQNITVARANELVHAEGAKMIINGTSSDTVALGELAYDEDATNDLGVPIICVACSSPALHDPTDGNADPAIRGANRNTQKWIFGLAMSSKPQSRVLWNILVDSTPSGRIPGDLNGDGKVKISTIALDDAFGIGFQDAMQNVVAEVSPSAIYEKTKHPKNASLDQYDWGAALDLLSDNVTNGSQDVAPDVLIEFTFPQFSLALVKAYSGTTPFLHTHSMREQTVVLASANKLDGHEGTSYLPSDGEAGERFDLHFLEVFQTPRESQWDAHVYDGGILFALATVKASMDMVDASRVTGAQIRDAMLELNDPMGVVVGVGPNEFAKGVNAIVSGERINYEGASGPCDFDQYGRARNRIAHWAVEGSTIEDIAIYDCVANDLSCPRQD